MERGYPAELAKKKNLLRKIPTPQLSTPHAWMLTEDGLVLANLLCNERIEYDLRPDSVYHPNLRHDLAVQRVVGAVTPDRYWPARLLPTRAGGRSDAIVEIGEAYSFIPPGRHAIEVELTYKSHGRELDMTLRRLIKLVTAGECESVVYTSPSEGILADYRSYLTERDSLRSWKKNPKSGKYEFAGDRTMLSPDDKAAAWNQNLLADGQPDRNFKTPADYFHWWHIPWLIDGL